MKAGYKYTKHKSEAVHKTSNTVSSKKKQNRRKA